MSAAETPPPVGVIIPTRDRIELLQKALASVWAQDYAGPLHVAVVFDGPIPEGLDLPRPTREDHRLEVVESLRPRGLVHTRTHAFELLDTEFVALLDDDDEWLPHRLRLQMQLAQAHPDVELVGGGVQVAHDGKVMLRPAPREVITLAELLADRVMELHPSTFLIRSSGLRAAGGWDENLPGAFAEDYDLLLRMARRRPLRLVPEIVATVNWAGNSYFFSRWQTMGDALEMVLAKFPEFATSPRGRARVRGQIAFARAASGDRRSAWRMVRGTMSDNVREPRAVLAALVALKLVSPDRVQAILHRRGRGI